MYAFLPFSARLYQHDFQVNKEQRSALYEAIRGHVVTLRGSRVGSKVIWLL